MKIKQTNMCPYCGRALRIDVNAEEQRDIVRCDCGADLLILSEVQVKTKIYRVTIGEEE